MRRHARDAVASAAIAATLAAGVWTTYATDGASTKPVSVTGSAISQIEQLITTIGCQTEYRIHDDLYNFASMQGVYCYTARHNVIVARSYASKRDLDIALQDWPLDSVDRYLVRGETWFVIGPLDEVTELSERLPDSKQPTNAEQTAVELTTEEQRRSSCIRFLANAMYDYVSQPAIYSSERADFQTIYPGLPDLIEERASELQSSAVQDARYDDLQLESVLSSIQSPMKSFCA